MTDSLFRNADTPKFDHPIQPLPRNNPNFWVALLALSVTLFASALFFVVYDFLFGVVEAVTFFCVKWWLRIEITATTVKWLFSMVSGIILTCFIFRKLWRK